MVRYNFALTNQEKDLLWKKYKANGLSAWEANKRVEDFNLYLNSMVKRLVKQNKSRNHILDKFQREFENLYMKLEV